MSNLKIFSVKAAIYMAITAIFFQLLVLLCGFVSIALKPNSAPALSPAITSASLSTPASSLASLSVSTSQLDYNLSPPTIDFLSPLGTSFVDATLTLDAADASSSTTDLTDQSPDLDIASITINAVNPGYTTDAGKNSGELIELINLSDDELALDNLAIIYTAKPTTTFPNGKSTILYQFPAGSKFIGETILLRYSSSPEAADGNQDLTYDTSLAMAGSLSLIQLDGEVSTEAITTAADLSDYGEVKSSVCWLGGEDCLPIFSTTVKSRSYTTIIRNSETGEYEHVAEYTPSYNPEHSGLYLPPIDLNTDSSDSTAESSTSSLTNSATASTASSVKKTSTEATIFDQSKDAQCQGLVFSEILSYYDEDASEQFIEFYNSTNSDISLNGCKVKYKNKYYDLVSGDLATTVISVDNTSVVAASDCYVLRPEFKLTKNPSTENVLELYDINGAAIDTLTYPHGQKKSASYALIDYSDSGAANWQITYAVTPGEPNIYQQYKTCPAGKVINEATGNCVKAATVSSALADCPAGKYRNPATGRCKNIEDDASTSECKEGYERNPETGRCRKIKNNDGAEYPVVPTTGMEEKSVFIGLLAILGVATVGAIYVIFQFRREIAYFFRKLTSKLKRPPLY